ncbi:dihydrodipicolinate synthase family protein [Shouchella lehensis]|uniref:Dihydrodipicolinate synthase n=1 Tax=Shouchella lehensis G1 TaxID=1246626 RepID=A0A060M1X9_9BACI|nr:dihydrodipicolinate synthase family protein [Shouchella lehensis]AIC96030.1 Dihydrodipicolinate synthase [Shouchella lehensis G1]
MLREDVHVAVPTAFYEDETLYIEATMTHINHLAKNDIQSVLLCGSTGEQHSLTLHEKQLLLNAIQQESHLIDHMEILFGLSSIRQTEAVQLAKSLEQSSIAGILLGYPPYIRPTQREAIAYTEAILSATSKPVILYNNPARTGFDLSVETILSLSEHEQIIGIKEAGNLEKIPELMQQLTKPFFFYAGGEQNLYSKIELGFNRLSSISANVYPKEIKALFLQLTTLKPTPSADFEKLTNIVDELYAESLLVQIKKRLSMGPCRAPIGQ